MICELANVQLRNFKNFVFEPDEYNGQNLHEEELTELNLRVSESESEDLPHENSPSRLVKVKTEVQSDTSSHGSLDSDSNDSEYLERPTTSKRVKKCNKTDTQITDENDEQKLKLSKTFNKEVPFVFTGGGRQFTKLLYLPEQQYLFVRNQTINHRDRYICREKNCLASCLHDRSVNKVFINYGKCEHSHGPHFDLYQLFVVENQLKNAVATQPHKKINQIYEEVISK